MARTNELISLLRQVSCGIGEAHAAMADLAASTEHKLALLRSAIDGLAAQLEAQQAQRARQHRRQRGTVRPKRPEGK
jgi:hypothetical protein